MKDNDNPIQEYTPFRRGIDKLTAEDGLNSNYVDNDLHDCSSDLSGRASVIEERMHEEFARRKKELNKYDATTYSQIKIDKNFTLKNNYNFASIFVFIIIIIIITVFSSIIEFVTSIVSNFSTIDEEYNNYDESIIREQYDDFDYNETQIDNAISFDLYKENILITTYTSEKNTMFLVLENNNDTSFSNVNIKTHFYDSNDNFICMINTYINMIIGNNVHVLEISNIPEQYEKYEIELIPEYRSQNNNINRVDLPLEIEATENNQQKEIRLINFTDNDIKLAEIALVYLKNKEVVKIEKYKFFGLTSGEKMAKIIEVDYDETEIDDVYIILNDIDLSGYINSKGK